MHKTERWKHLATAAMWCVGGWGCGSVEEAHQNELALKADPIIFGQDDRVGIEQEADPGQLTASRAVGMVVHRGNQSCDASTQTCSIHTLPYDNYYGWPLCSEANFYGWPQADGVCTGFLVGPQQMITAGHCLAGIPCQDMRLVFGYERQGGQTETQDLEAYSCSQVVASAYDPHDPSAPDWALIELDRPVIDRDALCLAEPPAQVGDSLSTLGHPLGLPLISTPGGTVEAVGGDYLQTTLDAIWGNSGSPVLNPSTGKVVGLVSSGPAHNYDLDWNRFCFYERVCADIADCDNVGVNVMRSQAWLGLVDDSHCETTCDPPTCDDDLACTYDECNGNACQHHVFEGGLILPADPSDIDGHWGLATATSDDWVLVGDGNDLRYGDNSGAAYFFLRGVDGYWQTAQVFASDPAGMEFFGAAVALDRSADVATAVIAATNGSGARGSVYVFERTGNDWQQTDKLLAHDGFPGQHYGVDASVFGDTIVVGAPRDAAETGAAYVYVRTASGWQFSQKLVPPGGRGSGYSLDLYGDVLVVGSQTSAEATIYRRDASGLFQHETTLSGPSGTAFGNAIAVHDDTVVVGAYADSQQATYGGAFYIYEHAGNGVWQPAGTFRADAGDAGMFGLFVDVYGDALIAGGPQSTACPGSGGMVRRYQRDASGWQQVEQLCAPDGNRASDRFGAGHAGGLADASTAVMAAIGQSIPGGPTIGALHVFDWCTP